MNNDLAQFSEERLKELESLGLNARLDLKPSEGISLIRIALSVKQAKPIGFVGKSYTMTYFMPPQDSGVEIDDLIYTTPQPAHTERASALEIPMQPLHIDQFGTLRFKTNPIVQHLLDVAGNVGVNMNTIAMQGFEPEDQMQFAQLIGYSLSGYGDLSYVTDESYDRASAAAPKPESE